MPASAAVFYGPAHYSFLVKPVKHDSDTRQSDFSSLPEQPVNFPCPRLLQFIECRQDVRFKGAQKSLHALFVKSHPFQFDHVSHSPDKFCTDARFINLGADALNNSVRLTNFVKVFKAA